MKKTLYVLTCALCALVVLPAAAQVPSYVPTDGLVGWWPFNGNANDESGNGNDGVVNGATLTEDRFGNTQSAFSFNKDVVNEINIDNSATLDSIRSITISLWVNLLSYGASGESGYNHYINKSDQNNAHQFVFANSLSGLYFYYGNGNQGFNSFDNLPELNQWSNLALTYDYDGTAENSFCKFYLNGELVDVIPTIQQLLPSAFDLKFGAFNTESYNRVDGSLDDIAIFNRALTPAEINQLYTGTTPQPCVSLPSNLQQGLVGYWPFCGNANDESGNGNDGVVNGATLTEDRFGNVGSAYYFEKSNSNFIQGNLNMQGNEFTLSVWAKHSSGVTGSNPPIDNDWMVTFGSENPINVFELGVYAGGNNVSYGKYNDVLFTTSAEIGTYWKNYTITYSGGLSSIFENGELLETNSGSAIDLGSTSSFYFGRQWDPFLEFWAGSLDDIAIWNRALTPEEVQELYTLDACTFTVYDTVTVQDTTYTNIELYDTITVENIVEVYDTTTIFETAYDTTYTNIELFDTITVENIVNVYDTTTIVETEVVYDTITTENIVNVYDTSYITVTDTLLIDITFTGFEGQPSWLNTVIVYPNPANDHITIDYGNFALMAGYNTIITNAAGATVYSSAVNTQQVEIDINAWGSAGVYYMSIYDANGALAAVRHIVLE